MRACSQLLTLTATQYSTFNAPPRVGYWFKLPPRKRMPQYYFYPESPLRFDNGHMPHIPPNTSINGTTL
ncbi:hypothetical protein PM082_023625 [Marasmius tenuissimus]|nr:hypothetical protein PM082_023625 [Marasmius tenuissimus]